MSAVFYICHLLCGLQLRHGNGFILTEVLCLTGLEIFLALKLLCLVLITDLDFDGIKLRKISSFFSHYMGEE